MKTFRFKQPKIKKNIQRIKNLKWKDIKAYRRARQARRQRILRGRMNSRFSQKMAKVYVVTNRISLLMHVLLSCMINFVIEVISRHSIFAAWDYMTGSPLVFLYNTFMIFITFSVVYLVRRRVFMRIIISVVWLALGVTNGYMLMKRVTPFNAQDLKAAGEGLSLFNKYFSTMELVILVIGVVAVVLWVVSMWRRGGQYSGKMHRILSLLGVAVCFLLYGAASKAAIENRVVSTYFGNIAFAYEDYGLPYCFTASLFNTGISQPNGYTEENIRGLNEDGELTESKSDNEGMPNIIFIQLESFFDTFEVEFLETSEDPLPNFRKLSEEYSSGYFKVPSVGAGTANTEFEVLTGMNLRFFGPGEYPYKTVLKDQTCESLATALGELGYGTHALHNNGGNFYSRAKVFDNIGFDTFTSKEFMNILQLTKNGWSKDDILVEYILEAMDTTDERDFVFGISVQGHGDYPEEKVLDNPKIRVSGVAEEGKSNAWEYYVNQVYEMDQFVGRLIEELEQRDEPTVVVFYGDHLPTMGLEAKDLKGRYLYNTNYVIWDNIGLEKEDRNIPAYQIGAEVLNRLDIHSGTVFNYHQERRKTNDYLSDLELLQYDILYGEQYIYEGKELITKGHMEMGVKDVEVHNIASNLDGTYSLYGKNFTNWSKVYINGDKQSNIFLNNTRLELKESTLEDGDILTVCQVGSGNTIFRQSQEYIYYNGQLMSREEYEEQLAAEEEQRRKEQENAPDGEE